MARCSRCGWEFDLDIFVCDNCGYVLQRERIERIPFFTRPETQMSKPNRPIVRIVKIINPMKVPYVFRDINFKKDNRGGRLILFFSSFFFALWVSAIAMHIKYDSIGDLTLEGMSLNFNPFEFSFGSVIIKRIINFLLFLIFFVFGMIYYTIVFKLYNWAFSLAGNFSVQLDDILAVRFNVKRKKKKFRNVLTGAAVLRRKKMQKEELKKLTTFVSSFLD